MGMVRIAYPVSSVNKTYMQADSFIKKKHYSFKEYLKLEEQDHIRYEYYKGEVFAMAGASLNHGDIVSNINGLLRATFRNKGCRSFQESYKLELLQDDYYVYPDVVLTCDPEDIQAEYILKHPVLIAEVLSPSTESYDRKIKFHRYNRLPSLKYFLFVSQERPFVELYSRPNVATLFQYQFFYKMEDAIHFPELNFQLKLQDMYEGITFPADENEDRYNEL